MTIQANTGHHADGSDTGLGQGMALALAAALAAARSSRSTSPLAPSPARSASRTISAASSRWSLGRHARAASSRPAAKDGPDELLQRDSA